MKFNLVILSLITMLFISCTDRMEEVVDDGTLDMGDRVTIGSDQTAETSPELIEPTYSRDTVMSVQRELSSRGFEVEEINGQLTEDTTEALKSFQEDRGIAVTGSINQETLSELGISGTTDEEMAE